MTCEDYIPVIDSHTHIFPGKIAEKATFSVGQFYDLPMYTEGTLEELEAIRNGKGHDGSGDKLPWKIVKQLICSPATTPHQTESINTFIADCCKKDSSLIGFGTLHRDNDNYEEELDRIVALGLKGIKFHFDFQKFDIDDEKMYPIYGAISERGLPVLFHMGDKKLDFSSPLRLARVMKDFPKLKIIAAHMGGYERWEEASELEPVPNVFFDISSSMSFISKDMFLRMTNRFGEDKFFFGSDFPMWNPYGELRKFEEIGLPEQSMRSIAYDNFLSFMSMDLR